jgi:hypothetical protein
MYSAHDIFVVLLPGLLVLAALLASSEVGYRIGRKLAPIANDAFCAEMNTIQTGTLSLLALLLGFSFAIGAQSYQERRQLIAHEAMVIARAHHVADLLPAPAASETKTLLSRYLDARIDLFYQGRSGEPRVRAQRHDARILQDRIWSLAAPLGRQNPRSQSLSLALDGLSRLSELDAERTMAMSPTVPFAMLVAVGVSAVVAMGWVGCGMGLGLGHRRNHTVLVALSLLFAVIFGFIVDLDEPRTGFVRSNQEPLVELRETMREAP